MKFVKVTEVFDSSDEEYTYYINVEQITRMYRTVGNKTMVFFLDRDVIKIRETPEDILIRLPTTG